MPINKIGNIKDLVELIESMLDNKVSTLKAERIFWDSWPEWADNLTVKDTCNLVDKIFYTFEDFVSDPNLIDDSEESRDIDEKQFLEQCEELLPKLKELAKNS